MVRFSEAVAKAKADGGIVSPTYFRDGISPSAYSISTVDEWEYKDRPSLHSVAVTNKLQPYLGSYPHLVLHDATGTVRFTLGYARRWFSPETPDGIIHVIALQRMRTCYERHFGVFLRWDAEAETRASKEFQEALAGMHPAEFLFAEFLYQNRDFLRQKLLRGESPLYAKPYRKHESELCFGPILERYFTRDPKNRKERADPILNPQKHRVRVILGLDDVVDTSVPEKTEVEVGASP